MKFKIKIILLALFIFCGIAQAQTPKLVHARSLAASGESGNAFKIVYGGAMGTGTLASNLLTLRMTAPHGAVVSSIVDNKGSTYVLGTSVDSGVGGWITSLYYVAGVQAGVTLITINYSAAVADFHAATMEYSGVATTTPADGSCSNHITTIQCSSAITTTASNDLVVASMVGLGTTIEWNRLSTIAPGGSFIFDGADTQTSTADEEFIQASAGTVTPSFTVTGSAQSFNIVGMAFKSQAGAGTNPTGMYILHQQHVQIQGSVSTFTAYFVSAGNLVVASYDLGNSFVTASIDTCNPANTWTKKTEGTFWPDFFYVASGSFSTSLSCTFHNTSSSGNGILVVYDIVGAAAAPFDTLASGQCQGNNGFVSCSITPTKGPGLMLGAANDGLGPVTQVGATGIFDNTRYTAETDTGQLNNGDAWQHLFYSSPSAITYTWSMAQPTSFMQASAITFDAAPAAGPPWTGIVASTRAVDWSKAGVVGGNPQTGGLPSDSWTQCVTTACNNLATPANVTAANINTAIAGAPANTFIQLPTGTFTIGSPGIIWNGTSNVELRGQGANSTFLNFTASNPCQGTAADVCFQSVDPNYQGGPSNVANWTAGYSVGATTITLSSITNLKVGNPIILDQADDTTDSGGVFICVTTSCASAGAGGYTRLGPPARSQAQMVTVTQCDGNSTAGHACASGANLTISPGLYMSNWRTGQTPQAWWATTPASNDGIRDISLDHTTSDPPKGTEFFNCFNCWQVRTRSIYSDGNTGDSQAHILLWNSPHVTVKDNYFFHNRTTGTASVLYGVALGLSSDSLVQNNIFEQVQAPVPEDGPCSGCVTSYNFDVNNEFQSLVFQNQGQFQHSVADNMLYEGNVGAGLYSDNFHGTHHLATIFRTAANGFQQNQGNITNQNTTPFRLLAYSRFYNVIGNVLGSPALPATTYQTVQPAAPSNNEIFAIGMGGGIPNDPVTPPSLMRWGNYSVITQSSDTPANSGIRFVSSEVPSAAANFPNPVPASQTLPPSFYMTAQPSWWNSIPWPGIGPDVSGGNLGICLGGTNKGAYVTSTAQCPGSTVSSIAGHANAIPAANCYLNVMGGSPIGTGSVLAFNPSSCYTGAAPPPSLVLSVTTDGAGSSHVGTAITTALSYTNPAGGCVTNPATFNICYTGSTLTVTNSLCTGASPCSWTLKDQNGTVVDTINTTAKQGQVTPLGQIDCSSSQPSGIASQANTTCAYNAPFEYPSTQLVTIGVTDGTTAASATAGFTYINNLNEYWTHRGRTLYVCPQGTCPAIPTNLVAGATINNIPWNIYANVTSPVTYQPLQTTFINTLTGNTEASIFTLSSDPGFGALVPIGAGSGIERPTMTYNGKWMIWTMDTPKPGGGSTGSSNWFQQMNGSATQILGTGCATSAYSIMPEKNRPGWVLTNDATNLKVCDLDNSQVTVNIAAHGMGSRSSGDPQGFSYEGGVNDSLYFLDQVNTNPSPPNGSGTGCSPIATGCAVNLKTFDVSPCYSSLLANCATVAGSAWNSFIQGVGMGSPSYGWDEAGNAHCTTIANFPTDSPAPNCEWHYHDIWFIPKSNTIAGLYGPGSTTGEAIFYQFPALGGTIDTNQCSVPVFPSTTVVTCLAPNTFTNTPYWSHPAFNQAVNYLVAYAGRQTCGPSGHTCTNSNTGNGVTDMRTNTSIYFSANEVVGHSAWDGYDTDHFGHDGGFRNLLDVVNGCVNEALREVSISANTSTPFLRMGCRPEGTVIGNANSYLLSPSQSSDATKLAWSSTNSQVVNNVGIRLGWLVQTRAPAPPVGVSLNGTSSAQIQWTGATLNRETMLYWVYKQASCSGNWTRLASVAQANWLPTGFTPSTHTYTDAALLAGTNACYGVTSQEWSGVESGFLSNTIKITNTAGTFSSVAFAAQGTVITLPAPLPVTSLSIAQKLVCATDCAAVNTPHAPTLTAGTGNITGTYFAMIVYGKCADFPNCNNFQGTLPSVASSSITVSAQGIRVIPNNNEMVGQDAIQLYLSTTATPASSFHLQTPSSCVPTLTVLNSTIVLLNNFNAASSNNAVCFIGTYNASGAPPPTTNTAVGGYQLNWTDLNNPGDRYDQIYYREGAAVNVTNELAAQPFLIATPPVGTGNFYDAFPNPAVAPANIHYAVVTKRMDGTRSAGVCMTGAGVSETCSAQSNTPLANVSPGSLTFSSQAVNTTSTAQVVTVQNVGTAPLVMGSPSATITGNFAISSSTCTANLSMVPNQTCQINVTFTPLSVGSLGGTLTVSDNSGGSASTQQVTLSGTGTSGPLATLSPNLAFGNQNVNTTSAALLVTLTNTGTQPVVVTQAQLFGTNFTLMNGTCFPLNNSNTNFTLPVGQSCNWGITFSPTATVAYTGTFQVTDNASGSPQSINLSGTGTQAIIAWSSSQGGTTYNYGNVLVGTPTQSGNLTLQNTGTGPLNVNVTITGANAAQFAIQSSTCPNPLLPGNGCTLVVTFTPSAAASYTAALTETDPNASNSPQNLTLNGTGATPPPPGLIAPFPVMVISQNRSPHEMPYSGCSVLYLGRCIAGPKPPSRSLVGSIPFYWGNGL